MSSLSKSFFAVIAGVGAGTGGAVSQNSKPSICDRNTPRIIVTCGQVAKRFAKAYPVVLLARREESYQDLVTEINSSGGRAFGVPTDVTSAASVQSAFQAITKELNGSKLAVAVYNVAAGRSVKPFLELQLADLDTSLKGNALVVKLLCLLPFGAHERLSCEIGV